SAQSAIDSMTGFLSIMLGLSTSVQDERGIWEWNVTARNKKNEIRLHQNLTRTLCTSEENFKKLWHAVRVTSILRRSLGGCVCRHRQVPEQQVQPNRDGLARNLRVRVQLGTIAKSEFRKIIFENYCFPKYHPASRFAILTLHKYNSTAYVLRFLTSNQKAHLKLRQREWMRIAVRSPVAPLYPLAANDSSVLQLSSPGINYEFIKVQILAPVNERHKMSASALTGVMAFVAEFEDDDEETEDSPCSTTSDGEKKTPMDPRVQ
ncbi:hypothetical protein EV359DRAFT_68868, partial [Lentinula novae-zelandiae]